MKQFKKTSKIIAIASAACLMSITAAMAQEVFVEGAVLPVKSGYALFTDSGASYKLEGLEQDLSRLSPRRVQVTGDLEGGSAGKTIKVKTVKDATY